MLGRCYSWALEVLVCLCAVSRYLHGGVPVCWVYGICLLYVFVWRWLWVSMDLGCLSVSVWVYGCWRCELECWVLVC